MRVGSLFSGVGGLDMAVERVFNATTAWQCEFDSEPSRALAKHWPGVPNFGDVTAVDWRDVEQVDVLCGGFPCQDVSIAGKHRGLKDGTRSGLWSYMAAAIDYLLPSFVVIENVRGLLSAEAHRDVEFRDATVGAGVNGPLLRAAGAVLGDLADLGYDARWKVVAAADAGAPHKRRRVFIVAYPSGRSVAELARGVIGKELIPGDLPQDANAALLATPQARDSKGVPKDGFNNGNLPRDILNLVAQREDAVLLSTPLARDHKGTPGFKGSLPVDVIEASEDFGRFESAVRHWEKLTRPAPPAAIGAHRAGGRARVNPAFAEWMMGWDEGHVTDVGLGRIPTLKAIGNGVVPQQAELALRTLLADA